MSNNPPAKIIRDGDLKASIWKNENDKGSFFSTTLAKTYTADNGSVRDTTSFSSNDLLRLSELARQAYSQVNQLRREAAQAYAVEQKNKNAGLENNLEHIGSNIDHELEY